MELLQLEYFRAIVTCGSMSRAAQKLFVSQPNLSVSMTRLEESLGFTLFTRKKGKITLTASGLEFLHCVERIFNDLDSSIAAIRSGEAMLAESIRVVTSMNDLLNAVMSRHYEDLRHLRIRQHYCDNARAAEYVTDGRADFGIVYGMAHARQLDHSLLHKCPRVLVMREGHPLCRYGKIPPQELPRQAYVCNRARDEQDILDYLSKNYRFTPNVESECDDVVLEMHILNSTNCVATMPLLTYLKLFRQAGPAKRLCHRFPDFYLPEVQTFLIRNYEEGLTPYCVRMIQYIKEFLTQEDELLDHYCKTGEVWEPVPRQDKQ